MPLDASAPPRHAVVEPSALDTLVDVLRGRGFTVIGPTLQSSSIVLDELESGADLARGVSDEQEGGTYRLARRDDDAVFAHNAGQNSWKGFLFPSALRLWRSRDGEIDAADAADPPLYAFLGVRSCDLAAIGVQDRVFIGDRHVDRDYEARRRDTFVVAVNCGRAGGTCFCVSMNTGPKADAGFDLALTELLEGGDHRFLVEIGTERGAEVLAEVPHRDPEPADIALADEVVERTAASMGRTLDTTDIKGLLYGNWEHPRWDEVSERCLTCGNCTLVCPTCFCHTVEDTTDLAGTDGERVRRWDSCFTLDHSYIHGGSVRTSSRSRYRQWMTHKLATWIDQFGTSGCVGCGRCITWCPVAIDITEETAAIRASDRRGEEGHAAD
jgi:sulfhydrogenase subunit beta (sulfur reductase)